MRVASPPPTAPRVAIGPVNSAGQGFAWARCIERHLDAAAVCYMTTTAATERFGFDADVSVPLNGYAFASGWQRRQRRELKNFTHLLVESGRAPYGPRPWMTPVDELRDLQASGVAIGLLWHGSDIRIPSVHAAQEPESPFGPRGEYPPQHAAVLERNARRHRAMVEATDQPVFVSTPGLLDVPRATWLPVVVDVDRWAGAEPFTDDLPVVAYAPSNSPMKGDAGIDEQLIALERSGVIRYRRVAGIPAREMPALYREADVVLDQFRLGDYGVAACEAMAAGRVVVGHVGERVREHVQRATGAELPIVEATSRNVGATIRRLLEDREAARVTAAEGAAFVAAVHSGAQSAHVLAGFVRSTD